MAIPPSTHDTRRAIPPMQRWLTRLIVFSITMYGSALFFFSPTQQKRFIHQRSLKGMMDQHADEETLELVRITSADNDVISSSKTKGPWQHRRVGQVNKWSKAVRMNITDTKTHKTVKTTQVFPEPNSYDLGTSTNRSSFVPVGTGNSTANLLSNTAKVTGKLTLAPLQSSDIDSQEQTEAELHAQSVKLLPAGEMNYRAFKCIGWRNTGNSTPDGHREPHNDLNCSEFVPNNVSGYCEVEDTKSGERFRVMRRYSNILRNRVPFRCINAPAFAGFRVQAHAAMKILAPNYKLPNVGASVLPPRDGIVMVVYPKLVPSAYATIRALREILGCSLPIEIWYRPDEMENASEALVPLQHLARNSSDGQISFHQITDPNAKRFVAKIYAIYNSFFDRVLFLDADNVPVRDPSFLFTTSEFLQTGAIFWPDFWHPNSTMFGLHRRSLLWELLGIPFVDMFEQESGQLVVDRRKHAAPLHLVLFYATHDPNFFVHYRLAWGDKDLFRLAWLKLNATFYMIETPPAMAGMETNTSGFCGMTMVQHDAEGAVLFLHRNKHKLTGIGTTESDKQNASSASKFGLSIRSAEEVDYPDPVIWMDLMSFSGTWTRDHYVIQAFTTSFAFSSKQKCFGRRSLRDSPQFHIQSIANQTFAGIETDLRHFAKEAAEVLALNVYNPSKK